MVFSYFWNRLFFSKISNGLLVSSFCSKLFNKMQVKRNIPEKFNDFALNFAKLLLFLRKGVEKKTAQEKKLREKNLQ